MRFVQLREADEKDVEFFLRVSKIPGFINLPHDEHQIIERILLSIKSFSGSLKNEHKAKYLFVAEDFQTKEVLGISMIGAQHGTKDSPHYYFEVGKEEKFSKTINTGFIHGTLELKIDTDGPSEIGGLVLDPAFRSSPEKIGRQISFVRFLYMGRHPERFKEDVLAELLPPLEEDNASPLWEAIGRRFTNMNYWEADQLCQRNKEFILSLFPRGKIYTTFLTPEARDAIGKVNAETMPVYHMLTKIGFQYKNQIDPFDGGPHLWAKRDKIVPVSRVKKYYYSNSLKKEQEPIAGLMTYWENKAEKFKAFSVVASIYNNAISIQSTPFCAQIESELNLKDQAEVAFMPYY